MTDKSGSTKVEIDLDMTQEVWEYLEGQRFLQDKDSVSDYLAARLVRAINDDIQGHRHQVVAVVRPVPGSPMVGVCACGHTWYLPWPDER